MRWDWGAFPVWREHWDDDKPELVISASLRTALQDWADVGSVHANVALAKPRWKRRLRRDPIFSDEWVCRGRVLSRRLQAEIGQGFEVVYFNEATRSPERIMDESARRRGP